MDFKNFSYHRVQFPLFIIVQRKLLKLCNKGFFCIANLVKVQFFSQFIINNLLTIKMRMLFLKIAKWRKFKQFQSTLGFRYTVRAPYY